MPITEHPLHGSQRAELPHWALTSGNDAKSPQGIGVAYASGWQPALNEPLHSFPGDSTVLTSPSEDVMPVADDLETKNEQGMAVHGHSVILDVPSNNRAEPLAHRRNRVVHASLELGLHRQKLRPQPFTDRLPQHREATIAPLLPADVRKAEEVEGLGFSQSSAFSIFDRIRTEFDETRLFGMQLQSELPKSFGQVGVKPLGIRSVLESQNDVIRKSDDDDIAGSLCLTPFLDPKVEHVVKKNIRQKRRCTASLWRSFFATRPLPVLQHTSVQPFLDEPHDAPVCNAVLDKLHQPSPVDGIEKSGDVGIVHPVHLLRQECDIERIQRIVLATLRSESVREAKEVGFVDRVQHLDRRALDDFIFQHRHAERPLPPVGFRYKHSANRFCSIRSTLQPLGKIEEIALQTLAVVPPRLSIYTGGGVSLQLAIGRPQTIDVVDVVQERSEPQLLVPLCCLAYSLERILRALSALCPRRVLLKRVPFGQSPSLHPLRSRSPGVVRRLRRYNGSVRLPVFVHRRRMSLDFPARPTVPFSWANTGSPGSRASWLCTCSGSLTAQGSTRVSRYRPIGSCLPLTSTASAPWSEVLSQLNTRPARTPVNASTASFWVPPHDSGPVGVANPFTVYIPFTKLAGLSRRTEAALCLVALPILKRIGLALNVSGREAVARLDVARSHAYEVAKHLPTLFCANEPAVNVCAGHVEELKRLRIQVAVLEYRVANAGSWCSGGRTVYHDDMRAFVLDLARRHDVGAEMTQADFAFACGIPLPTLKDWWTEERTQRRAQLELFASSATPTDVVAEPSNDISDIKNDNTSPPAPSPLPVPGAMDTSSVSVPSTQEPVRVSFSLEMCELIRKYDVWQGTFNAFYRELRQNGFRHGKTWLRGVLYLAAARKLLRHPPPQPEGRGSTFRPAPGLQWSSDGKQVQVVVDGETITVNWQPTVDIGSCAVVGTTVRPQEDTAGVVGSFQDGVVETTGAAPAFLLLDNKNCNKSEALDAALPDGTELMHATLGRATNKAHVEGQFGNFEQEIGPVIAFVDTSSPERIAATVAAAVTRAYSIGRNRRPRRSDGKSPYEIYLESDPSPEEIAAHIEHLRAVKNRNELRDARERARRDPRVVATIADACRRFGFVEDGDILASLYGYPLEVIQQAIAIYAAKQAARSLPAFTGDDAALRYFVGIARHCQTDLELRLIEEFLVGQIENTGTVTLAHIEQQAAHYDTLELGPRLVKIIDQLLKTVELPLAQVFWRRRLLDAADTATSALGPALRSMLCARIRRCYDVSKARQQQLILLVVQALTPTDAASLSTPL